MSVSLTLSTQPWEEVQGLGALHFKFLVQKLSMVRGKRLQMRSQRQASGVFPGLTSTLGKFPSCDGQHIQLQSQLNRVPGIDLKL